jgi:hypothetical protein
MVHDVGQHQQQKHAMMKKFCVVVERLTELVERIIILVNIELAQNPIELK